MIINELYINGVKMDLSGKEVIALDLAANDLGDIQSRNGDFTQPFELPLTNHNLSALENINLMVTASRLPYRKLPSLILTNGMPRVGYVIIMEVSSVIKVAFFGGNTDWFNKVGKKSVRDLNLDQYDHYYEPVTIRNARANNLTWTDVYNYPNVDYGPWQTSPTVYWTDFYTGVYYKFIVWKIWKEAGFEPVGDFWENDSLFESQFIPWSDLFYRDRDYSKRNSGSWDSPAQSFYAPGQLVPGIFPVPSTYWGQQNNIWLTNTIASTVYNILNPYNALNRLVILDNAKVTLRLRGTAIWVAGTGDTGLFMQMTYTRPDGVTLFTTVIDGYDPINYIPNGGSLNFDQTVTFDMARSQLGFIYNGVNFYPDPACAIDITAFRVDIIGYEVDESLDDYLQIDEIFNYVTVASTMADIAQIDILRTMMNQYGLTPITDFNSNVISLFSFADLNNNIPIAKDWSNKLDLSEKPSITFLSDNYAMSNRFQYAADPNDKYLVDNPDYCSGVLNIDNENLDTDKVVFQSAFAPVFRQSDSFSGTVRMGWIPKFIGGDTLEVVPRVGVILFENTHLITMDGFPMEPVQPAMHGYNISFGGPGKLLETYYPQVNTMLNDWKSVRCLIKFTYTDIHTLNHAIPVWIDHFQSYFYVPRIEQFKLTHAESCYVNLVKIG